MKVIKMNTFKQFMELEKGDVLLVKWSDYNVKHHPDMKKIMSYYVAENKRSETEIICRLKGNHYFNFEMFLNGNSQAEEVMLIQAR